MSQRTAADRLPWLPEAAVRFLRRRAAEGAGAVLLFAGIFLGLALASYAPDDASLNTAAAGPVQNLAGRLGAVVADVAMQGLGWAGFLVVPALLVWAWRLLGARAIARSGVRLAMLVLALPLAAAALVLAPPLPGASGGVVGLLLAAQTSALTAVIAALADLPLPAAVPAAATGALALGAWLVALGLSPAEWRRVGRGTYAAAAGAGSTLGRAGEKASEGARGAGGWLRRAGVLAAIERLRGQTTPAPRSEAVIRREPYIGARPVEVDDAGHRTAIDNARDDADGDGDGELGAAGLERTPLAITLPAEAPRVEKRAKKVEKGRRHAAEQQAALDLMPGEYRLPPLSLLNEAKQPDTDIPSEEALAQNARLLESVLEDFGIRGRIVAVRPGPVVTLYELEPAPGIKTSRVIGLSDDIARSMSAVSVRGAVVPGKNVIGLELPNRVRETVFLRELLASVEYENASASLTLALGKTIGGAPVIADLARMPHLLIAGTTGSGKSVAINTMILSLLYRLSPDECRMILIDPKMLELSVYEGIPHLLAPVVTEPRKAIVALKWTVREMEERYRAMSRLGVRNITSYNQRLVEAKAKGEVLKRTVQTGFDPATGAPLFEEQTLDFEPLPYIVVVVDEMADLMLVAGKEIEAAVQRLSQMARAAGIHLLMATQRPSVDVITGTIKANFPTRISFQVTSRIDSRTILNEQGAEQLLGSGDMLFMQSGGRVMRVHGPFVSDAEVERAVGYLKSQGLPRYVEAVTEEPDEPDVLGLEGGEEGSGDELYDQAVAIITRERKASTSFIQRHLQIGYNRAARIIERMEKEGVVSTADRVGKREVLARDIDALE